MLRTQSLLVGGGGRPSPTSAARPCWWGRQTLPHIGRTALLVGEADPPPHRPHGLVGGGGRPSPTPAARPCWWGRQTLPHTGRAARPPSPRRLMGAEGLCGLPLLGVFHEKANHVKD